MTKVEAAMHYLALMVLCAIFAGGLFYQFWPFEPSKILSTSMLTQSVPRGGEVKYSVELVKYVAMPARVIRRMVSSGDHHHVYPISDEISNKPVGRRTVVIQNTVPVKAEPGQYHIEGSIIFEYPFWRGVTVTYQTGCFTVTQEKECD